MTDPGDVSVPPVSTGPGSATVPPVPSGDRGSKLFGASRGGARSVIVTITSIILVFGVLLILILTSPGWPEFQRAFFNGEVAAERFPTIVRSFALNVAIFMVAEVFILIFALVLAIMRSLPGPVFAPIRILAIVYTDIFRGVPGILVVYILGFGMPSLDIEWIPTSPYFWGVTALVLVYTAYVSEVYRAGIESVHPSQEAAARSLGLSRFKAMRYVVLPQAIRRVIPPLLNDFIGLQKDSALVAFLGPVEAFRRAQIDSAATFNFTPYLLTAALFLLITVPLARLVDWMVARDRRRQLASAR
jgi:polar amino acid transport system permease protein